LITFRTGLLNQISFWFLQQVSLQKETCVDSLTKYCPDFVVGAAPGYRACSQTDLGNWEDRIFESNTDHWGVDLCVAGNAAPGGLFLNQDLMNFPHPSYRDIPALTVGRIIDIIQAINPPPASRY